MSPKLNLFGVWSGVLLDGGEDGGGSVRWASAAGAASASINNDDASIDGWLPIRMGISVVKSRTSQRNPTVTASAQGQCKQHAKIL
ncbi:MAG TPA: hypothetical protein VIT90_06890 [Lysobacter sp.]